MTTSVNVQKTINTSATQAWKALSSFRGIEDYSPIASSKTTGEGAGAKRVCTMPDGAEIFEVLNFVNEDTMEMQYAITSGPFPVEGYVSDISITADDASNCTITWACKFDSAPEVAEEMKNVFGGFYNVIIESLEGHLNKALA